MILNTGVMQQARPNGLNARVVVGIIAVLGLSMGGCADNTFTDLAVTRAAQTDPISPAVNQPIAMTFIVENRSGDYSPATMAVIRVGGQQVVSIPVDPIAGYSSRQVATSLAIGTPGAHSVAIVIDPSQQINDTLRDNNIFIFSVLVAINPAG